MNTTGTITEVFRGSFYAGRQPWYALFDTGNATDANPIQVCCHTHKPAIGDTITVITQGKREPVERIDINGHTIFHKEPTSHEN
jgi:hypothetical protein